MPRKTVQVHDHPGYSTPSRCQLGCHQRHPETLSPKALFPSKAEKTERDSLDEISIGKRHRYLTVVLDLKTGAVVFVGDGKGADALDPFWKQLKRAKSKIDAVAIDMSPAYISAIIKNLPNAKIVFDHFHVIKMFNDKLSELRRQLYHEVNDILQKQVIKGTR